MTAMKNARADGASVIQKAGGLFTTSCSSTGVGTQHLPGWKPSPKRLRTMLAEPDDSLIDEGDVW